MKPLLKVYFTNRGRLGRIIGRNENELEHLAAFFVHRTVMVGPSPES